ncbi:uncharacterized protein LOC117303994 [Asterias rubens]|uniref:uncharacterized protein LOC117303994 n=1 Tax=Asterias rubens TaxID=7604 RepID=UPI001455CBC6|nr:uncharacterized protein LOC117303994 [Asterias rubens]
MGRIRAFDIAIDNNALSHVDGLPVYSPGNQVTGVVNLHLNTSRDDVRVITIRLRGRAQTRWTETLTRNRSGSLADNQRVTFTGTETYIDYNQSLWQQEHPHQKLLQGLHSFPFEFRLPLINLPSDYEGVNGHVRYRLRCDIVGDSPLSNAKVGRKIAIAGCPMDLNCIHNAMVPVHGQTESLLSYWCCITSTVTTRASTDKRAYIPGETAYITAIVHGSSGTRYDVIIKLVQEATFRGTGSTYSSSGVTVETRTNRTCQRYRVLARKKTSGVLQRRGETTLQREPMIIPDNMPDTGFEGCSVIDINYFITVAPVVSSMFRSNDTEISLPISIGRIPFTALPSYLATTSHIGLPAEPPPSYATATSSLNVTPIDQSNISFVNQGYSPEIELLRLNSSRDENEPIISIPAPVPSTSNNHVANSFHGDTNQDQIDGRLSMTIQPEVHGVENMAFSSDGQVVDNSEVGEQLSTNVDDEDEVIGTLTPPVRFSSPVNTFGKRQESLEDNWYTEVTAAGVSDDMWTHRIGQRDTKFQNSEPDDTYFLPAYDDQSFCREDVFIDDADIQESDLQPILRLQSFFKPIGDSVIDQRTSISRETLSPPSSWKDDHSSGFDHQTAATPSDSAVTASMTADTRTWKDYVLLSEQIEMHQESSIAEVQYFGEEEAHFEPVKPIIGQNNTSVDASAARHIMPSIEFSSAAAPTRHSMSSSKNGELSNETHNKQQPKKRPPSLSKIGLRSIDLVLDNSLQQSRTPSPYFHPEDQREAKEDVASVSSFGSYLASSHTPRESGRRATPRLQEHTRSKSYDRSRDGTLPSYKPPRSLKHPEYYGSLDRQRRSGGHPTSHDSVSTPERRGRPRERHKSTPTFDVSNVDHRRRNDSHKFKQAGSIPKIDRPKTNSYRKLEDDKPSPSAERTMTQDSVTTTRQAGLGLRSNSSPKITMESSTRKTSRSQSAERGKHKQFLNPNIEKYQTGGTERTSSPHAIERTLQDVDSSGTRDIETSPTTRHYLWDVLTETPAQSGQDDRDSSVHSPSDKKRFETFV